MFTKIFGRKRSMQMQRKNILLAGLFSVVGGSVALADLPAIASDQAVQPTQLELKMWSEKAANIYPPATGCFHMKYPGTTWK